MAKLNWGGANRLTKIERNGNLDRADEPGSRRLARYADAILANADERDKKRKAKGRNKPPAR